MFIAADTSAVVRANPVIIDHPGSGSVSSASLVRSTNNAAIAEHRRAINAVSCATLASISPTKASAPASSNTCSSMPGPTDTNRSYPQAELVQLHQDRRMVARGLALALLADDLGVRDAPGKRGRGED